MSNQFWQRLNYLFGLLLVWPLFVLISLATSLEIKDMDLWLHLKVGEVILQKGFVPVVDVLSNSIAGQPWVNHEWLFQVIAYTIYHLHGPDGLIAMQGVVVVLSFILLLVLCYRRDKQLLAVFLLTSVLMVYQSRLTIRPDIFSLLFLISYIFVLSWHLNKRWAVYALFFVQVLWVNIHGFFFWGPFLVVLGLAAEWLKRHVRLPYDWNTVGRLSDDEYAWMKKLLGIVVLACLLNPLTFQGAAYPLGVLFQISGKSRIFFDYIQELQPSATWATLFTTNRLYYKVLILLSFLSFVFNRRKIDIGDLLLWVVFCAFSLVASRNVVFFAFIACLVSTANLTNLSVEAVAPLRFNQEKFRHMTAILLKVAFMVWTLHYIARISTNGYFDFDRYERKSEFGSVTQRSYPEKAVQFLVDNHIQGNFFNDFNSGAYLVGHCYPDIKVFIDGRTEVYGPEFFKEYLRIWSDGDPRAFDRAAKKLHLTGAFLNSTPSPIPTEIIRHLYNSKDWVAVYFNYDAVIFLRDIASNRKWIDKFAVDFDNWKAEKMDLQRLGARSVLPYRYANRAYTLESLGLADAALAEIDEALKVTPNYTLLYKLKGKIYAKKGDHQRSFENFRIAVSLANNITNKINLASAYEKLENLDAAVEQLQDVTKRRSDDPRGYFQLARVYALRGDNGKVLAELEKAHELAPDHVADILAVGDILYERRAYDLARTVFEQALAVDADSAEIYHKLGVSLKALGLAGQAQEVFKKGLSVEPASPDLRESMQGALP